MGKRRNLRLLRARRQVVDLASSEATKAGTGIILRQNLCLTIKAQKVKGTEGPSSTPQRTGCQSKRRQELERAPTQLKSPPNVFKVDLGNFAPFSYYSSKNALNLALLTLKFRLRLHRVATPSFVLLFDLSRLDHISIQFHTATLTFDCKVLGTMDTYTVRTFLLFLLYTATFLPLFPSENDSPFYTTNSRE